MKQNMGMIDRVIRVVVSLGLVALYFTGTVTGVVGYIFIAVAAIFTLTSILAWCPLYLPIGLSTKKD